MSFNWLFWPQVVMNPVESFDLLDEQGKADHAKVVPFMVLVAAFVAHIIGNPLPLWHLIAMFSASFGYSSWRTFLKAKLTTLTEANTTNTTVTREERDYAAGAEAT